MVVGLKVYKIQNQQVYENLRGVLSGLAFFRKDENDFFIKSPFNDVIKQFLELKLIEEVI